MLTLHIGQEMILYFNNKAQKVAITQIDFGEIIWVRFVDEPEKEEYYHLEELKNLINPDHVNQSIESIEDMVKSIEEHLQS